MEISRWRRTDVGELADLRCELLDGLDVLEPKEARDVLDMQC